MTVEKFYMRAGAAIFRAFQPKTIENTGSRRAVVRLDYTQRSTAVHDSVSYLHMFLPTTR